MSSKLADDDREVPDLPDVQASGFRVFISGLVIAAAVMLVAEMFMALVLRIPELLLVAAPITVGFLVTAGAAVGWLAGRVSRRMDQRKASLTFFVLGFLAGGLWGLPIFTVLIDTAAQDAGTQPPAATAIFGALYMASTTGLGGLAGRYFGPWASTKPRLVAMAAAVVLVVAGIGVFILSGDLS